jgi:hypothetical protein
VKQQFFQYYFEAEFTKTKIWGNILEGCKQQTNKVKKMGGEGGCYLSTNIDALSEM